MGVATVIAAALAALIAFFAVRLVAACGPVQTPNARSSHVAPTPVGGGAGVALGAALAMAAVAVMPAQFGADLAGGASPEGLARAGVILAIAWAAGMLGALDDEFDLGARMKIAFCAALGLAMALAGGVVTAIPLAREWDIPLVLGLGVLGTALWVFTALNATNFMDGVNGLVGGSLAVALGGLSVCALILGVGEAALLAGAGAGAALGFLPHNTPRARVFLGDTGALFLGSLFAGASLLLIANATPGALYLAPLLLVGVLGDALFTLAWRIKKGRSPLEGHRDHAYHARVRRHGDHVRAAARAWALSVAGAGAAVLATAAGAINLAGFGYPFLAFVAFLAVYVGAWVDWRDAKAAAGDFDRAPAKTIVLTPVKDAVGDPAPATLDRADATRRRPAAAAARKQATSRARPRMR